MSNKPHTVALGAFITGSLLIAIVALLYLLGSGLGEREKVVMVFDGSIKGLNVGAPLALRGVQVGQVTKIELVLDVEARLETRLAEAQYLEELDAEAAAEIRRQEEAIAKRIREEAARKAAAEAARRAAAQPAPSLPSSGDIVDAGEFADPQYRANPVNRCFFCKANLYRTLGAMSDGIVASGTNCDDLSDYRPGLEAARLHNVRHPYVEAGIAKADVRTLAGELGLPEFAALPASPCLSSRSLRPASASSLDFFLS